MITKYLEKYFTEFRSILAMKKVKMKAHLNYQKYKKYFFKKSQNSMLIIYQLIIIMINLLKNIIRETLFIKLLKFN